MSRVATVAGVLSELDDDNKSNIGSDAPSTVSQERMIIVGNQLPIRAHRRSDDEGGWDFSWDEDSLLLQLKDGLGEEVEVIYVGSLKEEIDPSEQDDVAQTLLETFKCVPAFIPPDLFSKFYHGFCKQHLWPLFHYMLPLSPELGGRFDRSLWQAYVSVNKIFADKVMEVISPDDDFVWVHDYHLMVLPTFLRKRFNRVKLGHFLSCCSRMLGLSYQSKRGYIGLEYYGRTVSIKILPVGIHMGQLQSVLEMPETESKVAELRDRFRGQTVLLGVDDMDIFKGISLKLLSFEQLLNQHPNKRSKVVLVQIANPARGRGKDVEEVQSETFTTVKRINQYGHRSMSHWFLIDTLFSSGPVSYYVIAECCLVTAVRDGMNLIPYEYIICRQGTQHLDNTLGLSPLAPKKSMLVVSEFIGCSPSLSGAVRVNPWNIDSVAEAMDSALIVSEAEKQIRHEKHYNGQRARLILLDYDSAMILQSPLDTNINAEAVGILNILCNDANNVVFIVSGKDRKTLSQWFSSCENLGIAAEHGIIENREWETCIAAPDFYWKQIAEPVMQLYTETTDGSFIDSKETSLVWNYHYADPDFGACQAKELLDHLESVHL
ncbi:hypothetical protein Leryth_003924 [Lithospermum erythrorhizon]|nr:hypothetical protein Leryth_003924 [Lithospermum erythrorhizon]